MRRVSVIDDMGRRVAARLDALRITRHMTLVSLMEALNDDQGYKISMLTLRRILGGQRAVTVDELVYFARVFKVHPVVLISDPMTSADVWKAMS